MAGTNTDIFQRNTKRTRNIHLENRKYKQHDSYAQTYKYMNMKTITLFYSERQNSNH